MHTRRRSSFAASVDHPLATPHHIALFQLARDYITKRDDDELAQRILRCLSPPDHRCLSPLPQIPPDLTELQTHLTNAALLADKVCPESPIGLLLRRLALAGQTLSFEALCALHTSTAKDNSPPFIIELALGRQPLAELSRRENTTTCATTTIASRVCRDLGLAVDLNHAANADTQAALLSLATLLQNQRGARAADELVRVAQQHADDVMLAHATAYCTRHPAARASAAALHLSHIVAYCDAAHHPLTIVRLAHAVRLAPHAAVEALYPTIPRAAVLHGAEQALAVALDRMHATAVLLSNEPGRSFLLAQATAALAVGDDVPSDDVAAAYAQLAMHAAEWDLGIAQRVMHMATARLPYYTGATLAAARNALAFDAALGAHDWIAANAAIDHDSPYVCTQRTLLALARGEYHDALTHAAKSPLLQARVLLAAGDWGTALHCALEALLHTGDAHAAVVLAEALLAAGLGLGAHAQQLLRDAVPVLVATRRGRPLARARCLLAALGCGDVEAHLRAAAGLYMQVGAMVDAAEVWQLLALRCEGALRGECAAQARRCTTASRDVL